MTYIKKDGSVIDEEWLARIAEAAEADALPGMVVTTQDGPGRPKLFDDDELVPVSFKMPKSRLPLLDRKAAENGKSRSQFLRDAVNMALI